MSNTPSKNPLHIEISLLICKSNKLTHFYTTRAPTERYFRTNYNAILKSNKYIKKKLDIRDYSLHFMPVIYTEIVHPQYNLYITSSGNY